MLSTIIIWRENLLLCTCDQANLLLPSPAKKTLSSSTVAAMEIDALFEGIDYNATISRAKFEILCGSLFKKC